MNGVHYVPVVSVHVCTIVVCLCICVCVIECGLVLETTLAVA